MLTVIQLSAHDLAKLLGSLNSLSISILPAQLHCRALQALLGNSLVYTTNNYSVKLSLLAEARNDLFWWQENLIRFQGRSLQNPPVAFTMQTDSSLQIGRAHV